MSSNENYKGVLQEMLQKRHEPVPVYTSASVLDPDSSKMEKIFRTEVNASYKSKTYQTVGTGKSKKESEKAAAYSALQLIYVDYPYEKLVYEGDPASSILPTFGNTVTITSPSTPKQQVSPQQQQHQMVMPQMPQQMIQQQPNLTMKGPSPGQAAYNGLPNASFQGFVSIQEFMRVVERMDRLERRVNEMRETNEQRVVELREYVDRKTKRKLKTEMRTPAQMLAAASCVQKLPMGGPDDSGRHLSRVTLIELPADTPDKITFHRYTMIFSHGFTPSSYHHLGKDYSFEGYMLYSPLELEKPVIHISNGSGDHFAISMIEHSTITVSREDFQNLVTFHHFFYGKVLGQAQLEFNSPKELYFVPNVRCQTDPMRNQLDVLIDLITVEDIATEAPKLDPKEEREYYNSRYLSKVLLAPRGDFNVCREIDFINRFEYKPDSGYIVRDSQDGRELDFKSDASPTLLVTHTSASQGKDYWGLKSLLFFDEEGFPQDPARWDAYNDDDDALTGRINFEGYIRKSKLYSKDPLICKSFGITSEMHAIAKVAVIVYLTELRWWIKLDSFKKNVVTIKNPRLLREVFTHPSTKRINLTLPAEFKIFRGYQPYLGDNQRLELSTRDDIKKPKADVVEALFGAVFLDKGLKACYAFIIKMLFKEQDPYLPQFCCKHDHDTELRLSTKQQEFLVSINVPIRRNCLFIEAVTCTNDTNSYQRLEFLGDSFLDMVVSEYLFETFPDEQEGFMSTARALLVRNDSLSAISAGIHLERAVSDDSVTFTTKRLGDLFESFIGCMMLEQGIEPTRKFIHRHLDLNPEHVRHLVEEDEKKKSSTHPIYVPPPQNPATIIVDPNDISTTDEESDFSPKCAVLRNLNDLLQLTPTADQFD
eukprot:gene10234-11928_t